jgi:hypothetical protein
MSTKKNKNALLMNAKGKLGITDAMKNVTLTFATMTETIAGKASIPGRTAMPLLVNHLVSRCSKTVSAMRLATLRNACLTVSTATECNRSAIPFTMSIVVTDMAMTIVTPDATTPPVDGMA